MLLEEISAAAMNFPMDAKTNPVTETDAWLLTNRCMNDLSKLTLDPLGLDLLTVICILLRLTFSQK
jgi:hypothetical protein